MMGLGPYIGREYAHDLVYDICREAVQAEPPAARPAGRAPRDQQAPRPRRAGAAVRSRQLPRPVRGDGRPRARHAALTRTSAADHRPAQTGSRLHARLLRRHPMKSAKLLKLLYVQVLIGLVLGITVGHYWPEFGAALKPLGDGFVKLVKMMIAPIVFCTIVSGITSLERLEGDRQDAAQVDGPVLCADHPRAAHRPGRGVPAAAGRRHAHRPDAPRRVGGREVRQPGAAAAASPSSCCTSFRTPSSAPSPKARCCRCCCSRCCAASA